MNSGFSMEQSFFGYDPAVCLFMDPLGKWLAVFASIHEGARRLWRTVTEGRDGTQKLSDSGAAAVFMNHTVTKHKPN